MKIVRKPLTTTEHIRKYTHLGTVISHYGGVWDISLNDGWFFPTWFKLYYGNGQYKISCKESVVDKVTDFANFLERETEREVTIVFDGGK